MAYTRKMAGKVPVLKQDLVFDATPTPGSENAVTSGGVAEMMTETVAPAFSASSTYAIGEVVIGPDGKLYQCTTAVETAGEWDPEDWTETSMVDLIEQDMKDMEEMTLLNLPCAANTLRFEFSKMDYDPTVASVGSSGTWKKLIAKFHNVWDWTRSGASWSASFTNAFKSSDNDVEVIAAGDTSAVTNMSTMFSGCSSLKKICIFDTSNVTNFIEMFYTCTGLTELPLFDLSSATNINSFLRGCSALKIIPAFNTSNVTLFAAAFRNCIAVTNVPLFDTGKATNVQQLFYNCTKVEGGALALYTQMSTQTNPPSTISDCFTNCGKDTTTGAAELAQIPASWGGTGT